MASDFDQAVAAHRQGRLEEARALYEAVLKAQPAHFDALHLLGVVHAQAGREVQALQWMDKAAAVLPDNAACHLNRGHALKSLQRWEEAAAAYGRAFACDCGHAEARFQQALLLGRLGAHAQALAALDDVVRLQPDFAGAHYNRGHAQKTLGQLQPALRSYERAIALQADFADAHCSRADVLQALGQGDAALTGYERAIAVNPQHATAWANRGSALKLAGRHQEAVASFDQAIVLAPDAAETYVNRGLALHALGHYQQAVASNDKAIALAPESALAWSNRGDALVALRQLEDALASYERAIALQPEHAQTQLNHAIALLLAGRFNEGWALYEWRKKVPAHEAHFLATSRPVFTPSQQKKRVLVWAEQGIGDEIMFGALLPQMRGLCSRLLVRADARLATLFARAMPDVEFLPKGAVIDEQSYDEHIAMGSLCQHLRPDRDSFQTSARGYLRADAGRAQRLRQALIGSEPVKLCGISWRSINPQTGGERTLALDEFVKPLAQQGYRFVSLQYDHQRQELEEVAQRWGITVLQCEQVDTRRDIDGLAALIEACDLVVSVGNSTVHLAGALGKDVRVLLPYVPSWRWQLEGDTSPWYTSARLYRQSQPGRWDDVLARVAGDLRP